MQVFKQHFVAILRDTQGFSFVKTAIFLAVGGFIVYSLYGVIFSGFGQHFLE